MSALLNLGKFLIKKLSIVMLAIMLGASNAILEEDRTLTDTNRQVKRTEQVSDEDPLGEK